MELVFPIRDRRKINEMKRHLTPRDRLLFVFGINSNLRISDILALKVGDVRGKDHINLREKKTKKAKRFLLNAAIKRELKAYLTKDMDDNDYLFRSRKGENKPITRFTALHVLKEAAEKAGIKENIGTHSLRKTWAYHRYKAGVPTAVLAKALNHSSERETLRYMGIEQDDLDAVYADIEL